MNAKLKTLAVVLSIVGLAGCSNSGPTAGAAAGSESAAGAESGTNSTRQKSLSTAKIARAAVTIPAQTLFAQELAKDVEDEVEYKIHDDLFAAVAHDDLLPAPTKDSMPGVTHKEAKILIASALAPVGGWNCDFFHPKDCVPYMRNRESAVLFANAIFQKLADKLSPVVMADLDEAGARIRKEFEAISDQDLISTWNQARKDAGKSTKQIDGTGFQGIRWMDEMGDYQGTAQGFMVFKFSMPFFGNGYINGKQIMLSLESDVSKSQQKSSETSESSHGSAGTGASSSTK